jgi:hypothetical protein
LTAFLHVGEYVPADTEHPCQGASPDLKLVWQPSTQLPVIFASFASRAATDIGDADGIGVLDDVRGDAVLRATARCFGFCGLATGASTRTLGSEVVAPEGVAVCDIAVPLRPHSSSAIEEIAIAKPATKSNEAFIAMSSQKLGREMPIPERKISRLRYEFRTQRKSNLGHKGSKTVLTARNATSGLPPGTDIVRPTRHVRKVPQADSCTATKNIVIRSTKFGPGCYAAASVLMNSRRFIRSL